MQKVIDESVGSEFQNDLLQLARNKTLEVIQQAALRVKVGMGEAEVKKIIQEIQTQLGAPKSWHPPQIRFGEKAPTANRWILEIQIRHPSRNFGAFYEDLLS